MLIRSLLELACHRRNSAVVRRLADEVVRVCHMPLWDRVRAKTCGMNRAEMRGYLRAQVGEVVGANADSVLRGSRLGFHGLSNVVALATEQLVDLLARDLLEADRLRGDRAAAA